MISLRKLIKLKVSDLPKDFDEKIHFLRGEKLSELDPQAGVALHVGCSGNWYFEWINEKVEVKFDKILGLEKYSPRPLDLDENVDWISSCAGYFKNVKDSSVDWIYSGQNLEHLWERDFVGFFEEASRVCKSGGILTLDTPNVEITERIAWNHPQHVAEFTLDAVTDLLELAGFDIVKSEGIYHVDFDLIKPVKLFFGYEDEAQEQKACTKAKFSPRESFIFWINARRSDRPISNEFREIATKIFQNAFNRRLLRIQDGKWERLKYINEFFEIEPSTPMPCQLKLALPSGTVKLILTFEREYCAIENMTVLFDGQVITGVEEGAKSLSYTKIMQNPDAWFDFSVSFSVTGLSQRTRGYLQLEVQASDCH